MTQMHVLCGAGLYCLPFATYKVSRQRVAWWLSRYGLGYLAKYNYCQAAGAALQEGGCTALSVLSWGLGLILFVAAHVCVAMVTAEGRGSECTGCGYASAIHIVVRMHLVCEFLRMPAASQAAA
jgi:hypothetical protein